MKACTSLVWYKVLLGCIKSHATIFPLPILVSGAQLNPSIEELLTPPSSVLDLEKTLREEAGPSPLSSDGALALPLGITAQKGFGDMDSSPRPEGPRANFLIFLSREYHQTHALPSPEGQKGGP